MKPLPQNAPHDEKQNPSTADILKPQNKSVLSPLVPCEKSMTAEIRLVFTASFRQTFYYRKYFRTHESLIEVTESLKAI